jgi:hypothetical protein
MNGAHASVESVGDNLHLMREGEVDETLLVEALSERRDAVTPGGKRLLPVGPKGDMEKTCRSVRVPASTANTSAPTKHQARCRLARPSCFRSRPATA